MIIQQTTDNINVLFIPETSIDRTILNTMPGLLSEGENFYCPNKQWVIQSLYERVKSRSKGIIRFTPQIKELLESQVTLLDIPSDFSFYTKPLPHQRIALRFAYTYGCFGLLLEPGLGKTKIILDYIWLKQFKLSLVICPKSLLDVWLEQPLEHRPEVIPYAFKTTNWEKEWNNAKIAGANLIVINYDKAVALLEQLRKVDFDFISVDEGLIKNLKTARTKAILKLGQGIKHRSIMSGTLINNSPLDVYAPIRFVEPALVGGSFTKFKNEYALCSKHNRFIVIGYRKVPELKDTLESCSIVMTKEAWLKDLPKKEFHHITANMGDWQRKCYFNLASNFLVEVAPGIEVEVDNPLTVLCKLTQISSGFVYYKEDAEEVEESLAEFNGEVINDNNRKTKKETFYFQDNPKSKALAELLLSRRFNYRNSDGTCNSLLGGDQGAGLSENKVELLSRESDEYMRESVPGVSIGSRETTITSPTRRAIIWYTLDAESVLIQQTLDNLGVSYLTIKGGDNDIGRKVKEFNTNANIGYLVCQAKVLNYGVTLMGNDKDPEEDLLHSFYSKVSDEIFFSLGFSLELFLQQQDRIHRIGQTQTCMYWLLLTNSPIEQSIADRLEKKLICNKQILVDIVSQFDPKELISS